MQSGFCTNCGQPLAPGAAFCPSCGTPVEASSAASSMPPAATQGSMPGYAPGSNTPAYNAPAMAPPPGGPATATKSRTKQLIGWVGGCLAAALIVVALLIGLLVYGLTTGHPLFFFIGLIGLALIIIVGAAVEHIIRRLIRRATGGLGTLERDVLGGAGGGPLGYQGGARQYRRQQPHFNPLRFLFTLALLAAAIYGGLFLYYTETFTGNWSGVLSMSAAKQGVLVNFQVSVPVHAPHYSASDPGALDPLAVDFKQASAQVCKSSQSYQLSGTASKLDASQVAMTLTIGQQNVPLSGTFQNGILTLSGKNAQGQPVTLTLQKGTDQAGYVAACG